MDAKLASIKARLPSSARELEPLLYSNLDDVYQAFKDYTREIEKLGLDVLSNSLRLWGCALKVNEAKGDNLTKAAFDLCWALQFEALDAVYDQLNVIPPLVHDQQLLVPLTVVVVMHMYIPSLNDKLPNQANESQNLGQEMEDICGPLTLVDSFKLVKTMDVDCQQFFSSAVKSFTPKKLFHLIDLFTNFQNCCRYIQETPAETLAAVCDLMRLTGNYQLGSELVTIAMLPELQFLLPYVDYTNIAVSTNARKVFQTVVTNGLFAAPFISDKPVQDLIAQSFALPDGVVANEVKRLHFDVLFEGLDNCDKCFQSGSFVRLFALATSCLENSMSQSNGALQFNRNICTLSPPLSSLATLCHLVFDVSRHLAKFMGMNEPNNLNEIFTRSLPPIPLRCFETARSKIYTRATDGMDLTEVNVDDLKRSLKSLIRVLYKNVEFCGSIELEDYEYFQGAFEMVVCALAGTTGLVKSAGAELTLSKLIELFPRYGIALFVETLSQLPNHSLEYTGTCVQLVANVLQCGNFEAIKAQLHKNELGVKTILDRWHETNAPCMQALLTQLHRYGFNELVEQSRPKWINAAIGKPPVESSAFDPVWVDLSKLENAPKPRHPPVNHQRRLAASRSFPNLAHHTMT